MRIGLLFLLLLLWGPAVHPCAAESVLDKGIAEYKGENFEEALEYLVQARQQDPTSSLAAFYLGLTYKQIGKYQEAAQNYRDALTLSPRINDAYAELIEMLFKLDQTEEAKKWIAEAEQQNIRPAHIAFLKGLVLAKTGEQNEALAAFEAAAKLDPSIKQAAELQIAMLNARNGKILQARKSLDALSRIDPTSDQAAFAQEYADALGKVIAQHKTWHFAVGASYQYDDNVISNPSDQVTRTALAVSGQKDHGRLATFRTEFSPLMDRPWSLNGQFSFLSNTYQDLTNYNVSAPTVSLTPGYNFSNGAMTMPLSYSHVWLGEQDYMDVSTVRPTLSLLFLPGHIGQFSVGYTRRDMLKSAIDPDEDRDGKIYSAGAGYIYPFANGKGAFNLRYEYLHDDTVGANWDNVGNRVSMTLLMPVTDSISFSVSGDVLHQDYQNTNTTSIDLGNPIKREDTTTNFSATFFCEVVQDLTLNLQYARTVADSNLLLNNLDIYSYTRNVYSVGLEYRF